MTFNVQSLTKIPPRAIAALLLVGLSASLPISAAAQEARWIWELAREIRDREPTRALHLMARAARLADTPELARVIAADAVPLLPHLRVVSLPIDQYVIEIALTNDGATAFAAIVGNDVLKFTGIAAGAPKAERIGTRLSSLEYGDHFAIARDGHIRVWNSATGRPLGGELPFAGATGAVLDDEALWIAAWDREGRVRTWDIATGALRSEAFIDGNPAGGELLPKIDRLMLVTEPPEFFTERLGYLIDTGSGKVVCGPIPRVFAGWSLGGERLMINQLVEGSSCDSRAMVLDHRSCTMHPTTPDDPDTVAVEPGGRWFVASSWSALPRVVDTATGEVRWQLQSEADGTFRDVSIDPSWRRLLRPTYDGIEVFSLETGERINFLFQGNSSEIQWSEDGGHILALSSGGSTPIQSHLYHPSWPDPEQEQDAPIEGAAYAWSEDGQRVLLRNTHELPPLTFWSYEASLSNVAAEQRGDAPAGMAPPHPQDGSPSVSEFRFLSAGGPAEPLAGALLLANGPRALLWGPQGRIWLWDLEQGRSLGAPIEVGGSLYDVVSDSAGKVILARHAEQGALVLLVEPVEPDPTAARRFDLREGLEELVWIDDVRLLARFADRSWAVVAADTGEALCAPPPPAPEQSSDSRVASDGEAGAEPLPWQLELAAPNRLVIWEQGSVTTWDLDHCRRLGDPIALGSPGGDTNRFDWLPFLSRSADGSTVLAWGANSLAWIDPESGQVSRTLNVEAELRAVLVIGERLALVETGPFAMGLLSLESGAVLPFEFGAGSHSVSPDQSWLAISAGKKNLTELIHLRTGQRMFLPEDHQVARFSDDGQRIVVKSWGSVSAFDLTHPPVDSDGGDLLQPRWSHLVGEHISDLQLSGDGQHVVFWPDKDGGVAVYDFTTGERVLALESASSATFLENARYLLTRGTDTLLLDRATGSTIGDLGAREPRDSFYLLNARFNEVNSHIVTCHQDDNRKRVRFRHWTLSGDPAGPQVELVGSCFSELPQMVDSSWLVAVSEGKLVWFDIGHGLALPPRGSMIGDSLKDLRVAPGSRQVAAWSSTGHVVIESPPTFAVDPANLETWLATRTANRLGDLGRTVVALPRN